MEKENEFKPILYLVMRKDIPDMNPGKAMAQACHAGNDMTHRFAYLATENPTKIAFNRWKEGGITFGTTITLEASEEEVFPVGSENGFVYGVVQDPTYPIRSYNGFLYTVCIVTCWWFFIYKECEMLNKLKEFPLHR